MQSSSVRFTTKYASPLLCTQEVQDVQTATQTFENMTVKARSATREVIATYTMQDLSMDLTVRIPANHPLGIITVDSEKKVGVGTTQWRNWTLQLSTFLRNQVRTLIIRSFCVSTKIIIIITTFYGANISTKVLRALLQRNANKKLQRTD